MATLRREWVSVEQAQQWIDTYDPKWMSTQVKDAMAKEISSGKKLREKAPVVARHHYRSGHEHLP